MKRTVCASLIVLLALGVSACSSGKITVDEAWIPVPAGNGMMLAGYATIKNGTGAPVTLVAASSEAFGSVSLHRTVVEKGMASMEPVDSLTLPSGDRVRLHPGGLHLMLMQPTRDLAAGDQVTIRLEFRDGATLPVTFTVREAQFD